MQRTDFTQEIDGAFANRNAGSRHFSEVARSGNGNMRTDLVNTDDKDYEELDGIGESFEQLTLQESAAVDALGAEANVARFRWPKPGETPPFASKNDKVWLRRREITASRVPGGQRVAKAKWVQVSKGRLSSIQREGQLDGLGDTATTVGISAVAGLLGGTLLWLFLRRKKA